MASTSTFDTKSNVISRLLLAQGLHLAWAMPVGMYALSRMTIEKILNGYSGNGTMHRLPPSLQTECLIAHDALMIAQNHETFRFLRSLGVDGCGSDKSCRASRQLILEAFTGHDRLDPLGYVTQEGWSTITLCAACRVAGQTEYDTARQTVWDQLPSIFNLPSWEELKSARDADLIE